MVAYKLYYHSDQIIINDGLVLICGHVCIYSSICYASIYAFIHFAVLYKLDLNLDYNIKCVCVCAFRNDKSLEQITG